MHCMNDKIMAFYDGLDVSDKEFHTFNTSIDIKNLETGEIIFKGLKNKVIIPGSGLIARKLFDIDTDEVTKSYNTAFGTAMYTPATDDYPTTINPSTSATKTNHKVLLYCCGIDGCGTENSQVYPVDYRKWIAPDDLVPFRFQLGTNDISDSLRETYFGRTSINDGEYIAYYFKRFEGTPTLIQQYIDGTPIDENVYTSAKADSAETYVELNMKITKDDIRDYFVATVGIDEARINSISLCTAYPVEENGFLYFKDIRPLTKLNIPNEQLIDVTKGIEIIYHIYM